MTISHAPNDKQILEGKVIAILSYLSILCIIPLLFKKDNPFVLSHGKQGLVIFVGEVSVFIAHIVLGTWVLRLGLFLFGVISLWGIIEVLRGRYIKLPVIAEIADKITL
ncbi:MAG TPA: hypothetical protein PL155_06645 [Candidatus Omnitrophota bacterium]|nr:hypothetical protein [Candidatus Omnitrophota bacterium]HPD83843.1 hypothetical protein [Candidatus Omnitrophota bacterium]HRZ02700.1 hypothetical protein [Candidatus Omnitrophota bacterium]